MTFYKPKTPLLTRPRSRKTHYQHRKRPTLCPSIVSNPPRKYIILIPTQIHWLCLLVLVLLLYKLHSMYSLLSGFICSMSCLWDSSVQFHVLIDGLLSLLQGILLHAHFPNYLQDQMLEIGDSVRANFVFCQLFLTYSTNKDVCIYTHQSTTCFLPSILSYRCVSTLIHAYRVHFNFWMVVRWIGHI